MLKNNSDVGQVVVHHDGDQNYTLQCGNVVATKGTLDHVVSHIKANMPHITSFPVVLRKKEKSGLARLLSPSLT